MVRPACAAIRLPHLTCLKDGLAGGPLLVHTINVGGYAGRSGSQGNLVKNAAIISLDLARSRSRIAVAAGVAFE